jgi:hypothetical protein
MNARTNRWVIAAAIAALILGPYFHVRSSRASALKK